MKIIVVLLSILFVGAVAMPLFIAEAVAQQNPPGAKAKKGAATQGNQNRPCRSRNRACY
jgi:hypothetical protein